MMRKKLEISDSMYHARARRYGTMRIWISNTAEHQAWQDSAPDADAFDFDSGTSPSYRVKIQGRLLDHDSDRGLGLAGDEDDDEREDFGSKGKDKEKEKDPDAMDEDAAEPQPTTPAQKPKVFSQFFNSLSVDFHGPPNLQPEVPVEWKRPEGPAAAAKEAPFSQLEFKRPGDENINITVNLQQLHVPERFRLSKPLAALLDTDEEDRASVMMGIWEYARANHLQQDDDERKFVCDAKLKAIFGQDMFYFPALPTLIKPHLSTLPPVQLKYTIRVDKDYISPAPDSGIPPSQPTVYDLQVTLDDPLQPLLQNLLRPKNAADTLEQIRTIDEQIVLLVGAIGQSKAKHAFFTSMSKDPVAFVKRWLSSQKRDLEVILGEASRGGAEDLSGGEWERGGTDGAWGSEVARQSAVLWLARQGIK